MSNVKIKQTHYEVMDPGWYPATINEIEYDEGAFGTQVKFSFELDNGETIYGWCSAMFSNRSKLYKWARNLLGGEVPRDYDFDSNDFIGRNVLLLLDLEIRDDGSEFNKVTNIRKEKDQTSSEVEKPDDWEA